MIRMRAIEGGPVEEYSVTGNAYQVIDIPPGFTHSITNVGTGEMVTLFWSSEMFDPNRPDTYYLPVDFEALRELIVSGERMKVATILGTRPEIIRLSRVIAALDRYTEHVLIHTGQNYDYELNQVFFEDLEIRQPDYFLKAAGKTAAETIGLVISQSSEALAEANRMQCWFWATPTVAWRRWRPSE